MKHFNNIKKHGMTVGKKDTKCYESTFVTKSMLIVAELHRKTCLLQRKSDRHFYFSRFP